MADILSNNHYKKIALFGGTFDPIHKGHIELAKEVKEAFNLDCVTLIPTGQSPHKLCSHITNKSLRFMMAELGTLEYDDIYVSPIEVSKEGPSFTIETINEVLLHNQTTDVCFVLGEDSLYKLHLWNRYEEIIEKVTFIVVPRFNIEDTTDKVKEWNEKYPEKFLVHKKKGLPISSTIVREGIRDGEDISKYLPELVNRFISKHLLYTKEELLPYTDASKAEVLHWLQTNLEPRRYIHSLSVAREAVRLANFHGVNHEKAYTAGLLHDCAKGMSLDEMKTYAEKIDYQIPEHIVAVPPVVHGYLGAELARHELHIEDEDIINGIKYHTTAREGMSDLEKIIFIADFTEELRPAYKANTEARQVVRHSLDEAMLIFLEDRVEEFGLDNCQPTKEAYLWFKEMED